jgi:hypothetical protein
LEISSDPRRCEPTPLAAPFQRTPPVPPHSFSESMQTRPVARHSVVLVEPVQYTPEPLPHLRYRFVHSRSKRLLDLLQLRLQPLPRRVTPDGEVPATVVPAAMREPQKRETFRLPLPSRLPVSPRQPAKLDQPRFLRMKLQPELRQPLLKLSQKALCLGPVLEPPPPDRRHNELRSHRRPLSSSAIRPPTGRTRSADRC